MSRQLIGRDHELPQWLCRISINLLAVKHVDGQRTIDFDRITAFFRVEIDAPTETANPRFAGLMQDGVAPDRQDCVRYLWCWISEPFPLGFEGLATAEQDQDKQKAEGRFGSPRPASGRGEP